LAGERQVQREGARARPQQAGHCAHVLRGWAGGSCGSVDPWEGGGCSHTGAAVWHWCTSAQARAQAAGACSRLWGARLAHGLLASADAAADRRPAPGRRRWCTTTTTRSGTTWCRATRTGSAPRPTTSWASASAWTCASSSSPTATTCAPAGPAAAAGVGLGLGSKQPVPWLRGARATARRARCLHAGLARRARQGVPGAREWSVKSPAGCWRSLSPGGRAPRAQFPGGKPRSCEDLKARYYAIARALHIAREGSEATIANSTLVKHPFNAQHERCAARRARRSRGRCPCSHGVHAARGLLQRRPLHALLDRVTMRRVRPPWRTSLVTRRPPVCTSGIAHPWLLSWGILRAQESQGRNRAAAGAHARPGPRRAGRAGGRARRGGAAPRGGRRPARRAAARRALGHPRVWAPICTVWRRAPRGARRSPWAVADGLAGLCASLSAW